MKLISCDSCGVLLDADKIQWPGDWETNDGIDEEKAAYFQELKDWAAYIKCPCCQSKIAKPD